MRAVSGAVFGLSASLTAGAFFHFAAAQQPHDVHRSPMPTATSKAAQTKKDSAAQTGASVAEPTTATPGELDKVKEAARNSDTFANNVALNALLEVEAGKLAQDKASDEKVKEFGQHMIADHEQATAELEQVAKEKGIKLPTKLDTDRQAILDELKDQSGKDFDVAYTRTMRKDHEEALTLFRDASTAIGVDRDLQAFAKRNLRKVEEHRSKAMELPPLASNQRRSAMSTSS
jgi:putative membrane protein